MPLNPKSLQRQFAVVSENPPSSPFEGQLWRDTSSDVLKQYNDSSWVSVQTSPDGQTIIQNQDGNVESRQAIKPSEFSNIDQYKQEDLHNGGTIANIEGSGVLHNVFSVNPYEDPCDITITADGESYTFQELKSLDGTVHNSIAPTIRFENSLEIYIDADGSASGGIATVVMD